MRADEIPLLLFDLALIIALAQLFGRVARRLGQPAVIGEILAGILLGPTLFGGALTHNLFSSDIPALLGVLADVGVAVFMFIIGLEMDRTVLRGQGGIAVSVAFSAILVPFGLGVAVAFALAPGYAHGHGAGFILYVGAALSVTAFPVLARILTERDMLRTPLGGLALTVSAIDDLLAWVLLAFVLALSGTGGGHEWRVVLVLPYATAMWLLVRPLLRRLADAYGKAGGLTAGTLGVVFAGLLLSGAATEWMGLHFIFGAFLFGVVMPRAGGLRAEIVDRVGQFATVLLLPVFFVVAGLKVDLSRLTLGALGLLGLILVAAIGGKIGGTYVSARLSGVRPRHAAVLGVLINTRGLTELIILTVGLQFGLIDTGLYTLLVTMAVLTTALTGPLLRMLYPRERAVEEAERAVADAKPAPAGSPT
jgi:Kef-type K+ transport system membrane component KefB